MQALLEFAREKVPGFEKAYFVDFAPQTGVRQTRLLEGEYVVTKQDVLERIHFPDSVCRGRDYYTPYRALLPKHVDQLAGRRAALLGDIPGPEAQQGKFLPAWRWAKPRELPPCLLSRQMSGFAMWTRRPFNEG